MCQHSYSVNKAQVILNHSSMVKTTPGFQPEQRQSPLTWPSCRTRIRSRTSSPIDLLSIHARSNTQVLTTAFNSNTLIPIKNLDQSPRPKKSPHVSSLPPPHQMASPRTTPEKRSPSIMGEISSSTSKQANMRNITSASSVQSACLSCATWRIISVESTCNSNLTLATTAARLGLQRVTASTTWRKGHAWDPATDTWKRKCWPRKTEHTPALSGQVTALKLNDTSLIIII